MTDAAGTRRQNRWRRWALPLLACTVLAGTGLGAQARDLKIGMVYMPDDSRFDVKRLEKSYPGQPLGRPKAGAEVAIQESAFQLGNAGLKVTLQDVPMDSPAEGRKQVLALMQKGVRHFLLDLPGAAMAELSQELKAADVLLFNVSAPEDKLRRSDCSANLFHALPDESMMADAMAQFLTARKWTRILLLTNTSPADSSRIQTTRQAIKRYGIKVVADKPFKLSNDPRERDLGNVALLTAGADADAIWVVDTDGEFARDVPYRTNLPRPVVGSAGLVAEAWQTSWERHGAPQLTRRFKKAANRPMAGSDWAAWIATKAIIELAIQWPDGRSHRNALRSADFGLDGFKGARLSFRPWDQQLRQPVFLAHGGVGGGIAGVAPLEGFLHPKNNLDTLGSDEKESPCKLVDSAQPGNK